MVLALAGDSTITRFFDIQFYFIMVVKSAKISGSWDFSSGVNFDKTKSTSPSCLRSVSFPVPRRRRAKSSVPRCWMMDLRPLLPPAEPFWRRRVVPNGRLKSSQMTRRFSSGIL